MSDDELRLNRLHRYQKTSPRLALEVHSHCEVPAGCGGVVLRWRDADGPSSISATFYVAGGDVPITLDGVPFDDARGKVLPGRHVLAFVAEVPASRDGFVLGSLKLSPPQPTATSPSLSTSQPAAWSASRARPADERWRLPAFDAAGFAPLEERPVAKPSGRDSFRYDMLARDYKGLGPPPALAKARGPLYVRAVFSLTPRGFEL